MELVRSWYGVSTGLGQGYPDLIFYRKYPYDRVMHYSIQPVTMLQKRKQKCKGFDHCVLRFSGKILQHICFIFSDTASCKTSNDVI